MPRLPRYAIPGHPQHVIQRGNNRMGLFRARQDFAAFAECLSVALGRHDCMLHAYVFMTNHVHLLMTPGDKGSIPRAMQSLGRRYVRFFNDRYGRTGTLWEGRYRATVIETERYLLTCYRYIELNPVRARLVADPEEYLWSSYAANACGMYDPLVTPHDRYVALGPDSLRRQQAYQALFRFAIDAGTLESIRRATNTAWALGSDRFCRRLETQCKRRSVPVRAGRPQARPRSP